MGQRLLQEVNLGQKGGKRKCPLFITEKVSGMGQRRLEEVNLGAKRGANVNAPILERGIGREEWGNNVVPQMPQMPQMPPN
jgi:hypothetical protein